MVKEEKKNKSEKAHIGVDRRAVFVFHRGGEVVHLIKYDCGHYCI